MVTEARIMGFGGSGEIANSQVLITSGNLNREKTFSYMQMMEMKRDSISRSKVAFSEGVWIVNGSIGFDATDAFLNKLTTNYFLKRNYEFDVGIFDGVVGYRLQECYYTNLTINGASNGLITCSVNFLSKNDFSYSGSILKAFIRDEIPVAYWESGNLDVFDWNLNITQEVNPKYLNQDSVFPKYLRVGLWEASLDVSTYNQLRQHDDIVIRTKTFTLTGNSATNGYTYGGQTAFGTYNHHFETGSVIGAGLSSRVDIISVS